MTYSSNTLGRLLLLTSLFMIVSCSKEPTTPVSNNFINQRSATIMTDWVDLSLDLTTKCNGFNDPIASRSMYYIALTLYESLLPGLQSFQTLQVHLNGFNTTLPQPDPSKSYNWFIVTSYAMYQVANEMYKAAGSENLNRIKALRDAYVQKESVELDPEIIQNSKDLGNNIGWKMVEFSKTDGLSDAYLQDYPEFVIPQKEGNWIPTSPDYFAKPLMPYWGNNRVCVSDNLYLANVPNVLKYSADKNSIMYAEAVEVYNLSSNLDTHQRNILEYWNSTNDKHGSPVCHNMLLMIQLVKENKVSLDKACSLFLRLALAHYDAYIIAWKIKYDNLLLRPSSYIKFHIDRYYIPYISSIPAPEFVSEKAVLYSASSRIFSETFGYRFSFMDYTQSSRTDLRENRKYFDSFEDMAKEASYSDLYGAVQFRTSIDVGYQIGSEIAANILKVQIQ